MSVEAPPNDPPPGPPPSPKEQVRARMKAVLPIALVAAVIGAGTALIAGSSKHHQSLPGNATTIKSVDFAGNTLATPIPAPGFGTLQNYDGGPPVSLAADRGKAVFVTFLYTHCPDVCPLIASSLHTAMVDLGPRTSQVRLVAVSVDPHGDNRADVTAFLREHQLSGQISYLLGSATQLAPVWQAWHVGSYRDAQNPELVSHTGLVYGISASGRLISIYASNFAPKDIVHDVTPLLHS